MSDLLNGFNNGINTTDGIGGQKPIDQLANDVDASDSGLHLQRVRRSYLGKGTGLKENDKYILNATRARALLWLHPIVKHIVIKLEEWDEEEYYHGTVMFDKNRAIDIRNKLDELICAMGD